MSFSLNLVWGRGAGRGGGGQEAQGRGSRGSGAFGPTQPSPPSAWDELPEAGRAGLPHQTLGSLLVS